jgi:hypothetical protein
MNNYSGPLEAEILACLEGLELALIRCQLPIIVEIDCSQLVVATRHLRKIDLLLFILFQILEFFLVMRELVIL